MKKLFVLAVIGLIACGGRQTLVRRAAPGSSECVFTEVDDQGREVSESRGPCPDWFRL